VLVVVAVGTYFLFLRSRGAGEIPDAVRATAQTAGCDDLEQPVVADPSRAHLGPGEAFDYEDPPAAAGPHDPSPLPSDPHVHASPIPETRAVHNLEHANVLVYYRDGEGGLAPETVRALASLAGEEDRVIMAPYSNLPGDRALALLAWNTRWMCPPAITTEQAVEITQAFVDAFRGTTVAPEAPRGILGSVVLG
jgi:hypothetical protein